MKEHVAVGFREDGNKVSEKVGKGTDDDDRLDIIESMPRQV